MRAGASTDVVDRPAAEMIGLMNLGLWAAV